MDFATIGTFTNVFADATATTGAVWMTEPIVWILVVGFVVAFILSFAVGANDVANSFGTTVGAKVLTLKQACVLATIFETAGAVFLGAKVGETIRKGIIDVESYKVEENGAVILMLGELSAMFGSAVWQLIATLFKLPVSGTHSIVGACIGFSLVAVGTQGVNWVKLGLIVASWFISPVLSGIMAIFLFVAVKYFVLRKRNPFPNGFRLLPLFYAITIGINVFSILFAGAPLIGLDHLLLWQIFLISVGFMVVTGMLVFFIVIPRIKKKIVQTEDGSSGLNSRTEGSMEKFGVSPDSGYDTPMEKQNMSMQSGFDSSFIQRVDALDDGVDDVNCTSLEEKKNPQEKLELMKETDVMEMGKLRKSQKADIDEDSHVIRELFSPLQVLTACFASFAHGGNDVSNAIGPLIALWLIFWSGQVVQKAFTPWYLLLYGGAGICVGLWLLGRRVIETIGSNLTKVTPSRGFCIELMTAVTVLIASNIGLPVSTTHCKVGAVVSIGWFRSRASVDWKLVGNIALAWFITVPVSGLLSAGAMWILMQVAL